jgi:hypothetical protein
MKEGRCCYIFDFLFVVTLFSLPLKKLPSKMPTKIKAPNHLFDKNLRIQSELFSNFTVDICHARWHAAAPIAISCVSIF